MLYSFINTAHLIICFVLIFVVLLQQGKGADVGATFGGGGNTLFGASGADTLLSRVTKIAALLFMATSLYLAVAQQKKTVSDGSLFQNAPETQSVLPVGESSSPAEAGSVSSPLPTAETEATGSKVQDNSLQQPAAAAESAERSGSEPATADSEQSPMQNGAQ